MRVRVLSVLACAALLALTACAQGTQAGAGRPPAHLEAHDVRMASATSDVSYAALAQGNRQLGYELAGRIPSDSGNLVFSPVSLSLAFAMLREGATGKTAAEIDNVLHLSANRSVAYNALLHQLAAVTAPTDLEVNDGLFLDPALTVKQSYLEALKRWYGGGVEQTAFPHPALEVINSWVDGKTHGLIPMLLDHLDAQAVFALINTVYLDAQWQQPFMRIDTAPAKFATVSGNTATVEMMHSASERDYSQGAGWQAVRLPYRGNDLSMIVLLPRTPPHRGNELAAGKSAAVNLLSPATLTAAEHGFTRRDVELSLPKWNIDTSADLVPVLMGLGLNSTFAPGGFSALTADPSFSISQVVQQARITVGEKGTKAAAATAIIGEESAAALPPHLVRFTADHPFAFAIVHDATGVPLFEGVVGNPS